MTDVRLGRKLEPGEGNRDAIHVAIFPATAAEDLYAGDEVGLVYGTRDQIRRVSSVYGVGQSIGLVDPFLGLPVRHNPGDEDWYDQRRVARGQGCYVLLFPGTVTGMRHHWTHPNFDAIQVPTNESEMWLRQFADKWQFDYDEMIRAATAPWNGSDRFDGDRYVVAHGRDLHSASELDPGDEALFWYHIERLTEREYSTEHRESFGWSCTC